MYCMMYLDDISSLITIACCVRELHTIEFHPFPIENVLGGATFAPPSTFSMGNRQNSLAHNSRTQQAIVIKLEISSNTVHSRPGASKISVVRPEHVRIMRAERTVARGVWGHAPPGNFWNFRRSEIDSGAF